MEKVLITGGAGFIGSHLAEKLYMEGLDVYVLDNLSTGKLGNISFLDKQKIFLQDIGNKRAVDNIIKKHNFTYIIHLAAVVSVVDTVNNPINSHNINVNSTLDLLESVRLYGKNIKKVLFASSAAVYGRNKMLPKHTDSAIDLVSPYAIQKFNAENYMSIYSNLYGVPTVSLRFFNVYGPRQNVSSTYSGVLSIMNNQFANNRSFTFYGDGEQTRDFIYIKDLIEAINIVLKNEDLKGKVCNVGTGNSTSLNEVFNVFKNVYGYSIVKKYESERVGDIRHSFSDITELKELGFNPKYDIKKGLEEYVQYTKTL